MALLEILTWPDERLRRTAEPVTDWSTELTDFIVDMFDTMYEVGAELTQNNKKLSEVVAYIQEVDA